MRDYEVGFIGGGNMTLAIAGGLVASGWDGADIAIAEPNAEQRQRLENALPGAFVSDDNATVAAHSDCLVLATKPQVLPAVCRDLANAAQESKPLIVSIAAGVRSDDIDTWLGGNLAVVRVMPNQPALLRKGVSGIFANERVNESQLERAAQVMAAVGRVVRVTSEADIDAVTAISGSGPAYFFLLIDMLQETAQELGLDEAAARTLALETATGAAALAASSDTSMDELIARVRSPGGTTAAALDSLDAAEVRAIFARAFTAARDRAVELADIAHDQN